MAGISWLCPRGSEGGPDAKVPYARPRVGADVDQAIAWISALTVHVWVDAGVAGEREQVLAGDVHPGGRSAAEQQARRQVVAERELLEPEIRPTLDERAVERAGAVAIGSRDHGVGVCRVPMIQHAGPLVRLHDVEAAVGVSSVDHLVSINEAEERVEREPAVGERVAEPSVELWLTVAEDGAVRTGNLAVRPIPLRPAASEVGDLVLARRAVGRVRHVARGARVALLPQAGDPIAVNRAERLAHSYQEHIACIEEVARARRHGELRDGYRLPRCVRPRPEVEHLVAVVREGQRAAPGQVGTRDLVGRDG